MPASDHDRDADQVLQCELKIRRQVALSKEVELGAGRISDTAESDYREQVIITYVPLGHAPRDVPAEPTLIVYRKHVFLLLRGVGIASAKKTEGLLWRRRLAEPHIAGKWQCEQAPGIHRDLRP